MSDLLMKNVRGILSDSNYPEFVKKYRYEWVRFCEEMIGKKLSNQQQRIIESVQKEGSLTSVAGLDSPDLIACLVIAYLISFPHSEVAIVSHQQRSVTWKYLKVNFNELCKRAPWIEQYFVLTDTAFYEKAHKGVWKVTQKSFHRGKEEYFAGICYKHLFIICEDAHKLSERLLCVIFHGSITEKDSRLLLLPQSINDGRNDLLADCHSAWGVNVFDSKGDCLQDWRETCLIAKEIN